jgi:hypothetical protein
MTTHYADPETRANNPSGSERECRGPEPRAATASRPLQGGRRPAPRPSLAAAVLGRASVRVDARSCLVRGLAVAAGELAGERLRADAVDGRHKVAGGGSESRGFGGLARASGGRSARGRGRWYQAGFMRSRVQGLGAQIARKSPERPQGRDWAVAADSPIATAQTERGRDRPLVPAVRPTCLRSRRCAPRWATSAPTAPPPWHWG